MLKFIKNYYVHVLTLDSYLLGGFDRLQLYFIPAMAASIVDWHISSRQALYPLSLPPRFEWRFQQ